MRINLSTLILLLVVSCSEQKKGATKPEVTPAEQEAIEKPEVELNKSEATEGGLSFESLSLLSGKLRIEVPEELKPMDAEMFGLKYPLENPVTTIAYSNEDATVTLLISPRQEKATQEDLPKYQQMLFESFGKNQSIDFRRSNIRKINNRDFVVIEMVTPAADTRVYNLMFVTSLEGKLLMSTFNCTVEKLNEWQPLAEQIVSSVRVND